MIIFIDIDDTICNTPYSNKNPKEKDYTKSTPIAKNIKLANEMYEKGHTIIYWTARGTVTGKNWNNVTKNQFKKWKVKYHELKFGKPYYDLFIDDKNINTKDWKKIKI